MCVNPEGMTRGITIIRHLIPGWWLPQAERWVYVHYVERAMLARDAWSQAGGEVKCA